MKLYKMRRYILIVAFFGFNHLYAQTAQIIKFDKLETILKTSPLKFS